MEYRQLRTSIPEEREKENLRAVVQEQSAIIDYIAVMADIDIPTEQTEGGMNYEE